MNKIIVSIEFNNERVDKCIPLLIKDVSRSFAIELIKNGSILINNSVVKPSYKLKEGDVITYVIKHEEVNDIVPQDIPLDIVYEDDDVVVINKEQGMVVHPANGHYSDTLVNALIYRYKNLSSVNGDVRPGIVHRIDKDTSGLLVVAKNDRAHNFLAEQLKDHTMHREYKALVKGTIKENEGMIDLPIARSTLNRQMMAIDAKNGKDAVTYFKVEERFYDYTLISCKLKTGRTHQIRVHMAYIKHPIEGDTVYSKSKNKLYDNGQLLHAYKISFIHPSTKKEMTFECDLPAYFYETLNKLR